MLKSDHSIISFFVLFLIIYSIFKRDSVIVYYTILHIYVYLINNSKKTTQGCSYLSLKKIKLCLKNLRESDGL